MFKTEWRYQSTDTGCAIVDVEGFTLFHIQETRPYSLNPDAPDIDSDHLARYITKLHNDSLSDRTQSVNMARELQSLMNFHDMDTFPAQVVANVLKGMGYPVKGPEESPFDTTEYEVCVDCYEYIAELEPHPDDEEDLEERIQDAIERELDGAEGQFHCGVAPTVDDPEGEGLMGFSMRSCELCRSTLGGDRYGVTMMTKKEPKNEY